MPSPRQGARAARPREAGPMRLTGPVLDYEVEDSCFMGSEEDTMRRIAIILGMFLISGLALAEEKFVEKRFVASVDSDGVQRVTMTGGEYFFDPNVIVVKANVPVELTVRKEAGITPHDITLKAPEAGIDIKTSLSKEPTVLRFTPTRAGAYPFECGERFLFFKSHKDRGMHGVLEVVAEQGTGDGAQGTGGGRSMMMDKPTITVP